ncbi:uncharacterized protein LOC127872592 [Dreissena polymorpha]|uniref:uncharacterized protein LOC127872592 n=1 Tax=Dreissena polymorpha TaxID=45954 RepID=UPI002263BDF6|nr:uncharacterized protein LOC127872592 [Dreissena polymorpha]
MVAFSIMSPIWSSKALFQRSKARIFNTNVKAVLLDGSETWRVTNTITNKIQTFVNKYMRHILNIMWPEKISNTDLWNRTNHNPVGRDIKKRKWGWIGHALRKPVDNVTRQALDWNPQGKRKVGRPKQSWRRSVEGEERRVDMDPAQESSPEQKDLDFADDIGLLSHKQQHAQSKLTRPAEEAEKTGLRINTKKTELMRMNNRQHQPLQLRGEDLIETDRFMYLGSVVNIDGGADEDV